MHILKRAGLIATLCLLAIFDSSASEAAPLSVGEAATKESSLIHSSSAVDEHTGSVHDLISSDAAALRAYGTMLNGYKQGGPFPTGEAGEIALYKKASPAVVLVFVGSVVNDRFQPIHLGTGVIIDSHGYILTNWHVINGFDSAAIFLKPVRSAGVDSTPRAYVATVVARDKDKDLAVLKLLGVDRALPTVPIASGSASPQPTEDLYVIGHPHAECWSFSTGVLSQVRNNFEWKYEDGTAHKATVLQLQTGIDRGNSGGPVLDGTGTLIGLVAAMSKEGEKWGYAIAAAEIQKFLATIPLRPPLDGTVHSSGSLVMYKAFSRGRVQSVVERRRIGRFTTRRESH